MQKRGSLFEVLTPRFSSAPWCFVALLRTGEGFNGPFSRSSGPVCACLHQLCLHACRINPARYPTPLVLPFTMLCASTLFTFCMYFAVACLRDVLLGACVACADNFVIQHNSWWGEYRLLLLATKQSHQIARATTKEEIVRDWEFIQREVCERDCLRSSARKVAVKEASKQGEGTQRKRKAESSRCRRKENVQRVRTCNRTF